jgi:cardiolipin synthase
VIVLKAKDIPNIISVLRVVMTIPVIYLLITRDFSNALILFAIAGASDALDGFLAKHYHWESHLGGLLDPLADKTLLIACYLILGAIGLLPIGLVMTVMLRDLIIIGGAFLYHYNIEQLDADPSLVSKLNTLMQILLVLAVVMNAGPFQLPDMLIQGLIWFTFTTTVASGANYVWVWGRRALERRS